MPYAQARMLAASCLAASALTLSFWGNAPSRASAPSPVTTSPEAITPGAPWADTSGNLIQGHNGSIVQSSSGTYYWLGQDLTQSPSQQSVACYSSTDLVHWAFRGDVLTPSTQSGWSSGYQIRTVKVIYDSETRLYVLWASVATAPPQGKTRGPANFLLDVATSPQPCGTYTWVGQNSNPLPFQLLGDPGDNGVSQPSGDLGLFKDANGTAYLLSEDTGDGVDNATSKGLYIYELKSDDTEVNTSDPNTNLGVVKHFGDDFEAPALFNQGGTYYVFASYKTNWVPNDNQYTATTASSLTKSDTWSSWAHLVPTPPGGTDPRTCVSQTMFVLPVQGTQATTDIYMGDRWDSAHQNDAGYVWLPIAFDGSTSPPTPSITCSVANWSINTLTGRSNQLAQPYFTFTNFGSSDVIEEPTSPTLDVSSNNGHTYQQWEIVNVDYDPGAGPGYTPYYLIENASSNDVLESTTTPTSSELTAAPVSSSGPTEEQEWEFVSALNAGQVELVNRFDGQVVAQATGSTSLDLEPFDTTQPNRLWALSEVPGYWAITSVGNVYNTAGTSWFGSLATQNPPNVVGFVPTPHGSGYWMMQSTGRVTNYGDAAGVGDITLSNPSSCPLAGATADPAPAGGFWAYDKCGNVYGDGGAQPIAGQTIPSGADIVALAATQDGLGYWLVDQSGTVYEFGEAGSGTFSLPNSGSCPIASAVAAPTGGFWALTICGSTLGAAGANSLGGHNQGQVDFTKLAATPDGGGYWLFEQTKSGVKVYNFGDATEGTETEIGTGTLVATVGDANM